jgi:hypothetical protein
MFIVRDEVPDAIGTDFMRPDGILFARQKINFVPDRGTAVFQPILRAANAAFAG